MNFELLLTKLDSIYDAQETQIQRDTRLEHMVDLVDDLAKALYKIKADGMGIARLALANLQEEATEFCKQAGRDPAEVPFLAWTSTAICLTTGYALATVVRKALDTQWSSISIGNHELLELKFHVNGEVKTLFINTRPICNYGYKMDTLDQFYHIGSISELLDNRFATDEDLGLSIWGTIQAHRTNVAPSWTYSGLYHSLINLNTQYDNQLLAWLDD